MGRIARSGALGDKKTLFLCVLVVFVAVRNVLNVPGRFSSPMRSSKMVTRTLKKSLSSRFRVQDLNG